MVWRLDRLGQGARRLVKTVEHLGRRGIGFRSLEEGIDTTAGAAKHVLAALAECERRLVLEHSAPGRAAARALGRSGGRRAKLDAGEQARLLALSRDPRNSTEEICRRHGINRATFYRLHPGIRKKAAKGPARRTEGVRAE